jgi:phosphoribulokinase
VSVRIQPILLAKLHLIIIYQIVQSDKWIEKLLRQRMDREHNHEDEMDGVFYSKPQRLTDYFD